MNDVINEAMFDFAMTCQTMIKNGWEFVKVNHGDFLLGVGPSLDIRKNGETKSIRIPEEMGDILSKEYEENCRKEQSVRDKVNQISDLSVKEDKYV